jgi:gas vesicle protein
VSGKEGELDDERATAIDVINSLKYTPVGSEKRPASSDSIEEEFEGEVNTSDIYIGLFGIKHSEPTIKEFDTARANNLCTLIFAKNLSYEEREPKLKEFLDKIKDSRSGVVISKYDTVIDLRKKILEALTAYLAKKFKEAQKLKREENKHANESLKEAVEKFHNTASELHENQAKIVKIQNFFGVKFSDAFGEAEFVDFKFPTNLEKGKNYLITAKIKGSTKNGFLDLMIKDELGPDYWFPDPLSYDSAYDNGKLSFDDGEYSATWGFSIPPHMKGKHIAIMGLYENSWNDRRCVNYEQREFNVV